MTLDDQAQTRIRYHEARGNATDPALLRALLDELTRLRALVDQLEDERDNLQTPRPTQLSTPLTRREASLLPLILLGQTNTQIGRTLGISPDTVKDVCPRLYRKFGVVNRTALLITLGVGS